MNSSSVVCFFIPLLMISSSINIFANETDFEIAKAEAKILLLEKRAIAAEYGAQGAQLCEEKKFQEAVEALNKAIILDPNQASFFFVRSTAYLGLGKFAKGIDDINQAIALEPINEQFYNVRAITNLLLGNLKKGQSDLATSATLGNDSAKEILTILKNHSIPLYASDEEEQLDPYFFGKRGAKLILEEKYEDALNDLDIAISLDPSQAIFYTLRGSTYAILGNLAQNIEDLDAAIALDPKNGHFYSLRAAANQRAGNPKESLNDFATAAKLGDLFAQKQLKAKGIGNVSIYGRDTALNTKQ